MEGLGRINLLVGTNNSGKTSVLEALYLLMASGEPTAFWRIISQRGERIDIDPTVRRSEAELDLCHLFAGHELRSGVEFTIETKNVAERYIKCSIQEASKEAIKEEKTLFADFDQTLPPLALRIEGKPTPLVQNIPLTRRGGLSPDVLEIDLNRRLPRRREKPIVEYIPTESLSVNTLVNAWNRIVLTHDEELVLRALRSLEPKIERIAAVVEQPSSFRGYPISLSTRGGFMIKLSDSNQPIPIGSLGDGTWRILALAIALIRAKHGVLLIDEIDTGLHYTVMAAMWTLVAETAQMLNVQVFATTHSYDCVKSLAVICKSDHAANTQVSIQRIEPNRNKAVRYTESQILMASERHIEVR
jgi:predicted ATPase